MFLRNVASPAGRDIFALVLVAPLLIAPSGAKAATDTEDKLRQVERTLDESRSQEQKLRREAERYAREIGELKRLMVVVARTTQDHETTVSQLETTLTAMRERREELSGEMSRRHRELAAVLAALERLARRPPVALAALPGSAADTVRGAILLRDAVPRLERRAATLKGELAEISELHAQIARQRSSLGKAGSDLANERHRLKALIEKKTRLQKRVRSKAKAARARAAALAADARDLRELLDRLARDRPATAAIPPVETPAPGAGAGAPAPLLPARGRIARSFGERISAAARAKGIDIETRPAAQVVAPRSGAVVFAGPFKGYGELLIIEYDDGYHVLLAGMSRIDAEVGDEVLAGEPVGTMNGDSGGKPTLYLELRRKGVPINPLPWLAATRNKVSG